MQALRLSRIVLRGVDGIVQFSGLREHVRAHPEAQAVLRFGAHPLDTSPGARREWVGGNPSAAANSTTRRFRVEESPNAVDPER